MARAKYIPIYGFSAFTTCLVAPEDPWDFGGKLRTKGGRTSPGDRGDDLIPLPIVFRKSTVHRKCETFHLSLGRREGGPLVYLVKGDGRWICSSQLDVLFFLFSFLGGQQIPLLIVFRKSKGAQKCPNRWNSISSIFDFFFYEGQQIPLLIVSRKRKGAQKCPNWWNLISWTCFLYFFFYGG